MIVKPPDWDGPLICVSLDSMMYGPTASQPKGVAVSDDGHVFVAEAGHVEALRSGQRVCAVDAGYGAISVAVGTGIVAVGGEVRCPIQRRW